jgi:23S rRNA (cytidine1920-2'-O)/16S rRNA (cytidine1409-2'-O)-methyltransferase
VEVGYGQLLGRLRSDPRVVNLERTNLGELSSSMLVTAPTLITLDLSYLSLTDALPIASKLLAPQGQILALIKPLFEVESSTARRSGSIDDPALIVAALRRVLDAGAACGLMVQGVVKLALLPRYGVHEFFAVLACGIEVVPQKYQDAELAEIITSIGIGPKFLVET